MGFKEFVENKRIAIVGPAPSAFECGQSLIESYDLIVRFNSAVPINPQYVQNIGHRTDILCNCLEEHPISGGKIDPKLWKDKGVQWVLSPYPRIWFAESNIKRFENLNKGLLQLEVFDANYYNEIEKKINTRPNSGILSILHILKFNIKEMFVTGFTFGVGGYQPGYKDHINEEQYKKLADGPWHSQEPQKILFKETYEKDDRIKIDKTLERIIS